MKGFRSIAALVIAGVGAPYITQLTGMSEDDQLKLAAGGVAALGVAFRVITTGPVFESARATVRSWLQRRPAEVRVSPETAKAIALAVLVEIAKRQKASKTETTT